MNVDEQLHRQAQRYAAMRFEEARKIRREKKLVPTDPDPDRVIYLAHYEAYKAGHRAARTGNNLKNGFKIEPTPEFSQEDAVREQALVQLGNQP